MKSQIGVVQMNSSNRLDENVTFAKQQIEQAADQGIDLVSFPETFIYVGENHHEKHQVAQSLDGELVQTFQSLASQHDVSVLLGSIYEKTPEDDNRLYNTSILINRQGELNGVYRKIHMCDAPTLGYNESVGIKPGNIPVVVD
ncbi:MAG: nitrilase-related carbon-nitrogen hydrolase, partial [Planktotalea sp.]|uniref:nitrilase-related carbon-nitrogen hydrolase n=1 Tax=Planktotalea sp. TaxID=2029877 RepID=UPI00261CF443